MERFDHSLGVRLRMEPTTSLQSAPASDADAN
jgi:hypothetical protein